MKKRLIVLVLYAVVVCGGVFAFDPVSYPDSVRKGAFLINGGFDIGTGELKAQGYSSSDVMMGGAVSIDYALPISFPLTLGGETGLEAVNIEGVTIITLPLLFRAAWHPDLEVDNLDAYVVAKIGGAFGFLSGGGGYYAKNPAGFAMGFDIGTRYFFSPQIAIFGELGWTGYFLEGDLRYYTGTYTVTGSKILSLGVSFQLGGKQ